MSLEIHSIFNLWSMVWSNNFYLFLSLSLSHKRTHTHTNRKDSGWAVVMWLHDVIKLTC